MLVLEPRKDRTELVLAARRRTELVGEKDRGQRTEKDGSNGAVQRNPRPDTEHQPRREEMEGLSFTESARDRRASRT